MSEHEEFEVGHHLDQVLRTLLTNVGQQIERMARRTQERNRQASDTDRQRQRQQETRARFSQQQVHQAREQMRRQWIHDRDSARPLFMPWTRPGAVERGDRVEAARAWAQARKWSEQDPSARDAVENLDRRIQGVHGAHPEQILESVADPQRPGGIPKGTITPREAKQAADAAAPFYYHRHDDPRLGRLDQKPINPAQEQLVQDWQHWADHGVLPDTALHESWAQHNGRGKDFAPEAFQTPHGVTDEPARKLALAEYWRSTENDRLDGEIENHLAQMRDRGIGEKIDSLPISPSFTPGVDDVERYGHLWGTLPKQTADQNTSNLNTELTQPVGAIVDHAAQQHPGTGQDTDKSERFMQHLRDEFRRQGIDPQSESSMQAFGSFMAREVERWKVNPAAILADQAAHRETADADASRDARASRLTEPVPVVVPADQENPDRGVAPSKATSVAEQQHRIQTWQRAEKTVTESGRDWKTLDRNERFAEFWKHYDTPEARSVTITPEMANDTDLSLRPVPAAPEPATAQRGEDVARPRERGFAPSKASSPEEKQHRAEAWRQAESEFRRSLPTDISGSEAGKRWQNLDWQDKALRYWSAYDDPSLMRRVGLRPEPATPAPGDATPTRSGERVAAAEPSNPGISRDRVVELNALAGDYFSSQMTPDSKGYQYLHDRLGPSVLQEGRWQLGYAPSGWDNLTNHLRQHGASDEEIKQAGLGTESSRGNVIDTFRDRAMVGVRDSQGDPVGFVGRDLSEQPNAPKYLNTRSTPAFTKGDHLLGLHEAPAGANLARVEGPFDAIAVTAAGNNKVAGVAPLGTALTENQADQFAGRGRVLFGLDPDTGGRKAEDKDFASLGGRGIDVRQIQLPDGIDPAELWQTNPDQLRSALANPEQAPSPAYSVFNRIYSQEQPAIQADDDPAAILELAQASDEIGANIADPNQRREYEQYTASQIAQLQSTADNARNDAQLYDTREEHVEKLAEQTHDPKRAERLDHRAKQLDSAEDTSTARYQTAENLAAERSSDLSTSVGHYDRGQSVSPERGDDVREARQVSAYGYTRSTRDMLEEADRRPGRTAKPGGYQNNQMGRARTQRK